MSCCENKSLRWTIALAVKQINEIYDILSCDTDSSETKVYLFMRAVLSPPEPDGQILYRPYMDSYKRTPKTEVCQVLFAFHDHYTLCLPGNQLRKSEKCKKLCQKREKRLKDCKKMVDIV